MVRKIGVALFGLFILAVLGALVMVEPVQGAKQAPNVPLTASFRSAVYDTPPPGDPQHYADQILNDVAEPYETNAQEGVSVWFTQPNGELFFSTDHHAARTVRVIFPRLSNETAGWLPDTLGFYAPPPEPVDFFKFQTYNSPSYADPRLNFLAMKHGEIRPVRLWTCICTAHRHYFLLNYEGGHVSNITGVVEVAAFNDTADMTKPATKWKIYPVPGTADSAQIWKRSESGRGQGYFPFGPAPMAFELTLQTQ